MIKKYNIKSASELYVTDGCSDFKPQNLPKWIDFMVWAGWEMRTRQSDSRQVMVLLLPERYCCSAFCSLGAILAGSTFSCSFVTWDEFVKFSKGDSIFFLYVHKGKPKPVEGVIGDFTEVQGNESRIVTIQSRNKALNGASIFVLKNNIASLQISKTPHASQIKLGRLDKISKFFRKFVDGYQESWMISNQIESVIVTNKAAWKRQMDGVNFLAAEDSSGLINYNFEISQLLMISDIDTTPSSHTRVISTTLAEDVGDTPLVVLDGVEALSRWESYMESNLIILLSRSEFTEEAEDIISFLSNFRNDDLLSELDFDPIDIMPIDSEMGLFALENV